MTNVRSLEGNSDRNPIGKVLSILRWFLEEPRRDAGVRESALAVHIAPSSAHRLLNALVREGFLKIDKQNGVSRYSLGMEVVRLAHIVMARVPIREVALRHMRRFVDTCNETVFLGLYDRDRRQIFFGTQIQSTRPLRYILDTEHWLPVYAGASGLAVMAFLPPEERELIATETRLAPLTADTISEPGRLEHFLGEIRDRGYAITRGQRIPGAVGMAAPIFGPDGSVLGDIATSVPEHRYDDKIESYLAPLVLRCANEVTREIGGRITGTT